MREHQVGATEETKEDFWEATPHSGLLYKLTNKTWSDFVRSHDKVLITIYNEDCPNCKEVRKHLAECAKGVFEKKLNVQLAVIDSDKYSENIHRLWTTDMGVPTLFWYEKEIKKFEYTKSRTAVDLLRFIQNPIKPEVKKKYPDWSMMESADSIYHYSDDGFDGFARDQEEMMVFFYSPTCRTCFQLRHVFEEVAARLDDEKPSVAMVAMNIGEALRTKAKYSINSYPHFAYFRNGKYKYQYNGKQNANSIAKFMKKPKYIPKPLPTSSDDKKESNVTSLTKETFDHFVNTHDHVMVMFFTQWCGHCKIFKPKYEEAAHKLKEMKSKTRLASIEGSEGRSYAKQYKVYGFPTLVYLNKGEYSSMYSGRRTAEDVVKFMRGVSGEEKNAATKDEIEASKPPLMKKLSPTNITTFLSNNEESFVMFYSPVCGACRSAKHGYFKAAVEAADEFGDDIGFGIVNALLYRNDVKDYDIKGYPTFWYFIGKEKKFKYHGQFTKKAFMEFFEDPEEKEESQPRDTPVQWMSEVSHVDHPNAENIDKMLKQYKKVMLFFYINVCEVCLNQIKPEFTKAAEMLHKESPAKVKLGAINGQWEKNLMKKYDVDSFPTFLYFQNGNLKYKYHGSWKSIDLVKFMKNPREDLAKKIKPTSWQDKTTEDFGGVVHLGNGTYDSFVKKHSKAVIMFHSLYYERCKKSRQHFTAASIKLADHGDIGFGAVDCHRKPEQGLVCYNLSIKKFPSYKFYENGEYMTDLTEDQSGNVMKFLVNKIHGKEEL